MSALILKDFYVLWRQARYFLILILIFKLLFELGFFCFTQRLKT